MGGLKLVVRNDLDEERSMKSAGATLHYLIDQGWNLGGYENFRSLAIAAGYAERKPDDDGYGEAYDFRRYFPQHHHMKRESYFRASSAGKCPQQQCYIARDEERLRRKGEMALTRITEPDRTPVTKRILDNGTWMHGRWHAFFNFLHVNDIVKTLCAERMEQDNDLSLSGTVDRFVEFPFCGKPYRAIVDFKSISDSGFKMLASPEHEHLTQMTDYFILYEKYKPDGGILMYENRDSLELYCMDVGINQAHMQMLREQYVGMRDWVDTILEQEASGELYPRPKVPIIPTQHGCKVCPWDETCRTVEHRDERAAYIADLQVGLRGDPGPDDF